MRRAGLAKTQLLAGLTFFGAMVVTVILVQAPWAHMLPVIALLALPGVHGALTAKNVLHQSRLARFSPILGNVELLCAGFLMVVAAGVGMLAKWPRLFYGGWYGSWVVAAIATLVLVIAAALDLIQAVRHRQNQRPALIKLLLQSGALILYCILLLTLGWLLLIGLSGRPYMGN